MTNQTVDRKVKIAVPPLVAALSQLFSRHGHQLYLVGGAVRDAVLGKEPKDFDLATDAVPDRVEEICQQAGFRTLPTGKAFGIINVMTEDLQVEIATFRSDVGAGRRPAAVEFTNIQTDVFRRDLTINAMFYDLAREQVIDLVGGLADLQAGEIRTVGRPQDRFAEDRLRILRTLRFAAKLGFELEEETDDALREDANLTGISPERIRDEFLKGLQSAPHFMLLLERYDLLSQIFPGLLLNRRVALQHGNIVLLSTLLQDNPPDVLAKQLNRLKYSKEEIRDILFLVAFRGLSAETAVQLKRQQLKTELTAAQVLNFSLNCSMDISLVYRFLSFNLILKAEDVMRQFNLTPGRELGDKLHQLESQRFLAIS